MSMALTHFAVGGTLTAVVALYLLPPTKYARTLVLFGGGWGMIPDIHWVTPVYAAELKALHSSVFANVFWLHETLDVLDPMDSRVVGALALAVFLVTVSLSDHWSYTTRERAVNTSDTTWPIEQLRSLSTITCLAGVLAVLVGCSYLLAAVFHPGVGSFQGLYLGVGMALLGSGILGVVGRLTVNEWMTQHVPRSVRHIIWASVSTGSALLGGVLLVMPLRVGVDAQAVTFAGVGSLLLVSSLFLAQLRLQD
ncbi:hypothetical protein ACOZ32_14215 (plasmid) [Halobacterium sp. MBLA0001]|uniref:hypothetical protein n=1 Tax=Halobacterium sp. MBLA0001 TaxID=3413511 RepID=UPI003C7274D0